MRLEDYKQKVIDDPKGLYDRGEMDQIPQDHFSTCLNIDFDVSEWKTRRGLSPSINLGYGNGNGKVRRTASFYGVNNVPIIVLILDDQGNLYTWSTRTGDNAKTPILTVAGGIDFSAIQMLGKVFITFHDGTVGLTSVNLKVYIPNSTDPTKDVIRDAAGAAPTSTFTAADGSASTIMNAGTYLIAVSFVTSTGFVTTPGPLIAGTFTPVSYVATTKKINLSNLPIGPAGTTQRQILITKANGASYFFLASAYGGVINDNSTTTTTLDFSDTAALVQDATYLFNLLQTIPCSLVMLAYNGRLVLAGENGNQSILRISRAGDLESMDQLQGIYVVNKDDGFTIHNFFVMRNSIYIWKTLGVFSVRDNGLEPVNWYAPYLICQTTNVGPHGIAQFYDMAGIRLSRDWTLLASIDGIVLFDGIVRKPAITRKVWNIWKNINTDYFHKIVLVVDEVNHRLYCAIPTNFSDECNVLLMAYYGLCPSAVPEAERIMWSVWNLKPYGLGTIRPTQLGIFTVPPETAPTLKIGSLDGGGKIWKFDETIWSDDGSDIETSFASALVYWEEGWFHQFAAARLRIIGSGTLACTISGEDNVNPTILPSINLTQIPFRFYVNRPPGLIDGNNTQYNLSSSRITGELLAAFQNGLLLKEGTDYTVSGKVVTFTTAPQFADSLAFIRSELAATPIVEVPMGNINSVNNIFFLSMNPIGTVIGFLNGLLLFNGIDFTVKGNVITMITIPQTNDELQFYYSASSIYNLIAESPAGIINGVNMIFTTSKIPSGPLAVFQNGLLLFNNVDYTVQNQLVTFTISPQMGDTIQFVYNFATSTFIAEIPTGLINGANTTFTTSKIPVGLILFQNGELLLNNTDYTLNGSTITFTNPPQTGDTVQSLYTPLAGLTSETPTGTINGVNNTFNTSVNPVGVLALFQNGLLLNNGVDFTIAANVITMTVAPLTNDTLQVIYNTSTNGVLVMESPTGNIDTINTEYKLQGYPSNEIVLPFWNGLLVLDKIKLHIEQQLLALSYPPKIGDTIQVVYLQGAAVGMGKEVLIRFNFQNEKASIQFDSTAGRFVCSKVEFFGKPKQPMRPS